MKKYLLFSLIFTASTLITHLASAQFLMASNMEDMDWPLSQTETLGYWVGNQLYAQGEVALADTGQKVATSFVPDSTAYLNKVDLPLTVYRYTNSRLDYPWPFGDSPQYTNSRMFDVGIFENTAGQIGSLLEKTQVEVNYTYKWSDYYIFGDYTSGSFADRGFENLPFTEVLFSNRTLLQAGESYYLGIAAATNDIGFMDWWNGDEPGDTIVAKTDITDPKPLESDWGALSSESVTPRAYRMFGTAQGSVVPEPATYGILGVLFLGVLIAVRHRTRRH